MNKKLLKTMALAACSLTFATTVGLGISALDANGPTMVKAYTITLDGTWVDAYDYGDTFTVPMGKVNGYDATSCLVTSPSDKVYSADQIDLTETGQYKVVWSATVAGKTYTSDAKTFKVMKKTVELNGAATLTSSNTSAFPKPSAGSQLLTLDEESSFAYNKIINLNDLWNTEPSDSVSIAKVFPHRGVSNLDEAVSKSQFVVIDEGATNYVLTLTDCYDPSNYVTIDLEWLDGKKNWNFRANAAGQKAYGLKKSTALGNIMIDGGAYYYSSAPNNGGNATQGGSYTDKETGSTKNYTDVGLEIKYDTDNHRIYITYVQCNYSPDGLDKVYRKYTRPIADLRNKAVYPNNPFKGFTTGEVYLSIAYKNITGDYGYMDIATIAGQKLTQDVLNGREDDTTKPVITVDEIWDNGNVPKIALNEAISVPVATVFDSALPYGSTAKAQVYYGYRDSSNPTTISVSNGKFTPRNAGTYTIVYTAKDPFGNETTKAVDLSAESISGNTAIKLAVNTTGLTSPNAGIEWAIPECTVTGLYTDASNLKVYADGKLVEGGKFFIDEVKSYTLEYVYETPFKTYTTTYQFTAKDNGEIAFSDPILPEYFIANARYTLDPVMAQVYAAVKPAPQPATVSMRTNGGAYSQVNLEDVKIPSDATTVQFKYTYNGVSKESKVVKAIDVGFGVSLKPMNYFHSEEDAVTKSASSSSVTYSLKSGFNEATLKYINVISFSSFNFDFKPTNLNVVTITFVDYYDRSNVLTYSVAAGDPAEDGTVSLEVSINNEVVKSVSGQQFDATKINLTYDNLDKEFELKAGTTVVANNEWKTKFQTDRVLFGISAKVKDETAAASLEVSRLANCIKFNNTTSDTIVPIVALAESYKGIQQVGRIVTISKASVTDVFAPYVKNDLKLTATDPKGNYVKALDGTVLNGNCPLDREYKVKLDQLGKFTFTYRYTDQNGKSNTGGFFSTVRDSVAPTLVVNGRSEGDVLEAALGSKIAVATYTVSDDVTAAPDIFTSIQVTFPTGLMKKIGNGKSFVANVKGTYTVVYIAYDEVGNFTSLTYTIVVK